MGYILFLYSIAALSAGAQESFVPLPEGQTPLTEIGSYRVAYQSYGGTRVDMTPGFVGSNAPSGIVYQPNESLLGREAIMMHSPWRVPVGKTWVDYPVHLPVESPITLKFGIAMQPDILTPEKSDGVTFGAYVIDGADERELMREHYAKGEWKDFQFDLASYAGKDVTIRLQVEPGPANNPGWDFSFFSDPAIRAGNVERPSPLGGAMLDSQAVKATEGVNLTRVANDPNTGVVPSTLLEVSNTVEAQGASYRFLCKGADCDIAYVYTPESGTLDDFTVSIDGTSSFQPALGGGVTGVVQKDGHEEQAFLRGGSAKSVERGPGGTTLAVLWEYPLQDRTVKVAWRFGVRGRALTVEADCSEPVLAGLSLGHEGNVAFRKSLTVPYLLGTIGYLSAQQVFACRYLDWTVSHASMCPQGDATYEPKTDGTRNALHESGYIAVSPNVIEVLPNLPNPPSPYLAVLGPRIMLDIWQHHKGTYRGDAENLRELKDNGVDHLAIISHVWQRYGYDDKLPDHIPANPQFGGDEGMKEFGNAANECGYLWSLHENYIDMYPDAPSFDETARALNSDGTPVPGWYNAGTKVQAFGIKCNRATGFAEKNSPEIHARFGTTAGYLDVHTCVPPWHVLDHDATQPKAAMAQFKYEKQVELFQFERDTHGGPLLGEGNQHFFWAGRCDGVEAQVTGGEDHAPFLDFDLLKIHPQMVNHGMGYYERWFRRGYEHKWGLDTGTVEQVDKYRAQEVAYGHAGFIGAAQTDNVQWVAKEHHLMHPIQRLMNTAKATGIAYEVDGRMAPIGVALAAGQRSRQCVTYDSGLRVWVNWAKEPWTVEGRVLPQWGFLAVGPDTESETVMKDGHFADYSECPEFLFADARTAFNMPYAPKVRNGAAIANVRVDSASPDAAPPDESTADFGAHMNAEGAWVDFGKVGTDGSVKISRAERELVVFPYPREKSFTVALDIAHIAGNAPQSLDSVRITALAARTQIDLGDVPYDVRDGRIVFAVGRADAGRYRIRW